MSKEIKPTIKSEQVLKYYDALLAGRIVARKSDLERNLKNAKAKSQSPNQADDEISLGM